MKNFWKFSTGVALLATMTLPSLAAQLQGSIVGVNFDNNTVTVAEGQKNYTFQANAATKFLTVRGPPLNKGIHSGDLRAGRHVLVNYETTSSQLVLQSLQIRR